MTFSASPPIVSIPRESGITSSSSQSSPEALLPARTLAWIAAPSATTLSGSRLLSGAWPKSPATACCTCGMRVAPPTITTPFTSLHSSRASRSALRVGPRVFATSGPVMSWNSFCVTVTSTVSPLASVAETRASEWAVRNSLAARDLVSRSRVSSAASGASLARRLVEFRGNGDEGAAEFATRFTEHALLGPGAKHLQDFRRNLHRTFHAGNGANLHHAGRIEEIVGTVLDVRDILQAAPHKALHRHDAVSRVVRKLGLGLAADDRLPVAQIAHDRRQQRVAVAVVEHHGDAVPHRGDQGIRGAEVDADRNTMPLGLWQLAGSGNLQQRHVRP